MFFFSGEVKSWYLLILPAAAITGKRTPHRFPQRKKIRTKNNDQQNNLSTLYHKSELYPESQIYKKKPEQTVYKQRRCKERQIFLINLSFRGRGEKAYYDEHMDILF